MNLITSLLINGIAIFIAAMILPGIIVNNFLTAIVVAVVLGVLNTFLKPVLTILTLPITVVTLGLFLLVINVLIIYLADALVDGFVVKDWLNALFFSLLVTLISSYLNYLDKSYSR